MPIESATIAALLVVCFFMVPAEPSASGGVLVFHTPLYYTAALLFSPATVLMGISIGSLIGRSVTRPRSAAWRIGLRATTTGLHAASASATVVVLKTTLGLPLAMLVAPAAALATGLTVNAVLYAGHSALRYGLPLRAELVAKLRDRYYEQVLHLAWVLPVAVGAVVLPRVWWPLLLTTGVLTSVLNGKYMIAELRARSDIMTRMVGHTLPTDDPAVRDLAEELALGVMVLTPDGIVMSITLPCLRVLGRSAIARNARLEQLCLPEDIPKLFDVIHQACTAHDECAVTVRVLDSRGVPRRVRLAFLNRLYDPSVRGLLATVMAVHDGAPPTERLQTYVNQALTAEILSAQEDERTRLAQELEDVRQVLAISERLPTSVTMQTLQHAVADMQRTLRAPAIDDLGLEDALRQHCSVSAPGSAWAIAVHSDLSAGQRFDHAVELTAYRIVQDGVAMCRRARLDIVTVTLFLHDGNLTVVVEGDRLVGDRGNEPFSRPGLMLLTARARLVGGALRTEASASGGQRIVVELPIGEPRHDS